MMKKVPKRRFKGFLNAGDWEQRKLGDVVKRESVTQVSSTEYPAIEYEDVIPETGQLNKDIYKKGVQKAGILFDANKVLYGKLRPYLHNWVAPMYKGVAVGDWWVLNPCGLDRGFLYTLIQTVKFDTIANQSTGSKMPRADWKVLSTTEFSIPSLDEQIKIGKLVEGLNDYITLHQRKLKKLKATKKALLYELFPIENSRRPKRRFKGFTDDWEQRKLISCIQKVIDFRGRTPNKLGMEWSCSGHLALSALNVKDGYIDFSQDNHYGDNDLYKKWMTGNELHKGQVVFTTEAPMGNVAQIPDNERYILSQRTVAFCVDENIITENFLAVLLRTPVVFKTLTKLSSGGTAQGISQKSLAEIEVRIPPNLHEQQIISNFLLSFEHCITLHQRKLEKLKNLKAAYLNEMFV